jgi:hypothetical protein
MGFFEEIHDLFADLVVSHLFQSSEFSIDDSVIGSHTTPNAMAIDGGIQDLGRRS